MIMNIMEMSTGHIKESTEEFLNCNDKTNDVGMIVYALDERVWLIWISDKLERDYGSKEIPEDLWECMVHAFDNCCSWLMLHCDAEEIDDLPVYNY